VSLAPDDATNRSDLLRLADVAMYQAKANRTGVEVYRAPLGAPPAPHQLTLLADLRMAFLEGQLTLRYQPIVDLATGTPVAAEALVRWVHPTMGVLGPDQFLPAVNQLGLFPQLTSWVVDQAMADAARFEGAGVPLRISVNISANDLLDPGLVAMVQAALNRNGGSGHRFTLEITEDTLVREHARVQATVTALRGLGLSLAVDDFGTGYQSLGQLLSLDIDEIKLDRRLVKPLAQDRKARAVVSAVVALAADLRAEVIAEGIEDDATVAALRRLGCGYGQGFHLAMPMEATDLVAWLQRRRPQTVLLEPPASTVATAPATVAAASPVDADIQRAATIPSGRTNTAPVSTP
jgi:EAL domain-containing protein (putative c-di-GMP-specific phosphodiesterase class I)